MAKMRVDQLKYDNKHIQVNKHFKVKVFNNGLTRNITFDVSVVIQERL